MNDWLALFLVALATARLIETLKELIPWPLQPWTKGALAMALGLTGAWLLDVGGTTGQHVGFGLGSAGLASLLHEVRSTLALVGDTMKVSVIQRAAARRR
jgi:hypothetical protein